MTRSFVQKFGGLTDEQLNWKPSNKTWSIGQNIQHLILVNESYFPIITAAKKGTFKPPFISKFDFIVNFLGTVLLKAVQPDNKKKTRTFQIWEPSSSKFDTEIITRFEEHQSILKQVIRDSLDLVRKGIVIASPANKNIVYKLDIAFDIIVAHEQRHFEQAKEVLARIN